MVLAMLSAPAVRPPATARAMAASERSFSTRKVAIASSMPAAVLAYMLTAATPDRKSTRLNSSHSQISYAVFCLKKKKINQRRLLQQVKTVNQKTTKQDISSR